MEGLYKKVVKGMYPRLPKYFSKDLCLILKAMLRVNPAKRPSCKQILNTNIISSRLNTLFPNEINDEENILLQTIYVPKKLHYLSERLPKSTYVDNDCTDEDTENSHYLGNQEEANQSLPQINTPLKKGLTTKLRKRRDSLTKSSKHSEYSYSIDINKNSSNVASPPEEYENIYTSKAEYSEERLQSELIVKEGRILNKNISESKFIQKKIPAKLEEILRQ